MDGERELGADESAAAARGVDDVGIAPLFEQGEVRVGRKSTVEDGHRFETILVVGEAIENERQRLCVGHVAFECLVGERKSVFVKSDAVGDLAAVIAVLLVFSVLGLRVGSAEAFEMAVGDIVENAAAAEGKKIAPALA